MSVGKSLLTAIDSAITAYGSLAARLAGIREDQTAFFKLLDDQIYDGQGTVTASGAGDMTVADGSFAALAVDDYIYIPIDWSEYRVVTKIDDYNITVNLSEPTTDSAWKWRRSSVKIGAKSFDTGEDTYALVVSHWGNVAIGPGAIAGWPDEPWPQTGQFSFAAGKSAVSYRGIAIGDGASVLSPGGIAIGAQCQIISGDGVAIGSGNSVSGPASVALGTNNTLGCYNGLVAIGWANTLSYASDHAYGENNIVGGYDGMCIGYGNTAIDGFSLAVGMHASALSTEAIAIGRHTNDVAYSIGLGCAGDLADPTVLVTNTDRLGVRTKNPTSAFHVLGSFATAITIISNDDHSLDETEQALITTVADGDNVYLPSAVSCPGRRYTLKKNQTTISSWVVFPVEGQTIDGAASKTITAAYGAMELISDGANWLILNQM